MKIMKSNDGIWIGSLLVAFATTLMALLVSLSCSTSTSSGRDLLLEENDEVDEIVTLAIRKYGGGVVKGVEIVLAPAWELECGGSCVHYAKRRIEVARGERWRQDLMHEVTHWLLYKDGHPPGTHHPIMYGRGLCYGGCDDVVRIRR
jgi:hypothetical protein